MPEPPGDPDGYELAFVEGRRTLDKQAAALQETRDRVGTLVSAAAVVAGLGTSLLFNDANRLGRLNWWGTLAILGAGVAFGIMVLGAVIIWRPLKGGFVLSSETLIGGYLEAADPASVTEIHREVAIHLGRNAVRNRDAIERRLRWFSASLYAFGAVILGLLIVLFDVA